MLFRSHPVYSANGPLRGSKWNLYEGGVRVPWIVRWPGRVPAGRVSDAPFIGNDLLPTLAAAPEYFALELICSIREQNRFDLIVLDTPPTAHALDFIARDHVGRRQTGRLSDGDHQRRGNRAADGVFEAVQIVARMLTGQVVVPRIEQHALLSRRVVDRAAPELGAVGAANNQGADGIGAVVEAEGEHALTK